MCAGAMLHARVAHLIFGAPDLRAGAAGTVMDVLGGPGTNHRVTVSGGILADDSRQLLQEFFRARRG